MEAPLTHGITVPIITPLDDAERVDEGALRRAIAYLLGAGVHGIFAMGSTGEAVALPEREWRRGIEIILDEVDGTVPVLAGVSMPSTSLAIERLRSAQRLGVAAAVATLPYFFRLNRAEIVGHYREVTAVAAIPVYAYDSPLTKMSFDEEIVGELFAMEPIVGLKDSSNNFTQFQKLVARFSGQGYYFFQGNETMLAHSLFAGASGGVLGLANVAPALCVDLFDACQAREFETAYALQRKLVSLHYISRVASNPLNGVKYATSLLGLGSERLARPLAPLDPAQKAFVKRKLQELGLLEMSSSPSDNQP